MSYHEKIIDLQEHNLFDLPVQNSDIQGFEQSGGNDNYNYEQNKEEFKNSILNETEMKMNQKFNEMRDFEDDSSMSMTGGGGSGSSGAEDPQLFDSITLQKEGGGDTHTQFTQKTLPTEIPIPRNQLDTSILLEGQEGNSGSISPEVLHPSAIQTGGGFDNLEGLDLEDLNVNQQIEENGNQDNPGEEAQDVDDEHYDKQVEEMQEPQSWVHPELTIEEDQEMIVKMNQEEIDVKVNMYLDNYNSDEYQAYLKYFQSIYSASNQKYSIRRDHDGNIYLIKRPSLPKELKGKKTRESVSDILNDKDFTKDYLIKLTPPEYLNVQDELKNITRQLNLLSGDIKILQSDLIELGSDITKDDIKKFEKIRQKFYKLINKKHIYTKYYNQVNNIFDDESKQNIYAKEIISDIDENDIKIFKLKYHVVKAPDSFVENITTQIKNNLENYSQIINDDGGNQKEYKTKLKTFLENKRDNENRVQKELNDLISFSKNKVDFLIKKLPVLDIKTDIF